MTLPPLACDNYLHRLRSIKFQVVGAGPVLDICKLGCFEYSGEIFYFHFQFS